MKKALVVFLIVAVALIGVSAKGTSETAKASNRLTVYSTVAEKTIVAVISQFEQETGIEVELVTAGVGELLKRIESEQNNPLADVLWGAALSSIQAYSTELFHPYRTENYDAIYAPYRIAGDYYTPYAVALRCLLVNTNLTKGMDITGYKSILNPALKGKISMVDPAASSSGYGQLANMLFDMGTDNNPESDAAWAYVKAFAQNLDGKLLNSSSAVWKGVCDGEYAVGLTYEEVSFQAVKDGYPVEIVYCEEGAYGESTTAAIVKGAQNLTNAEKFIDYLTSLKIQQMFADDLNVRGIRSDLAFSDALPDTSTITLAKADSSLASASKKAWLDRFMDIWTTVAF
jgi:iron(III) transport system substrate-binding protein